MAARFDHETITFLISDVARMLRAEFDRRTSSAGLGLTPGEARILVTAARTGSVRQSVLAERVGVEAMTLSSYLDRLEARGLVARVPDPGDRRAKLVLTTDAAETVLEAIVEVSGQLRADISATLTPGQLDEMREGLKEIRESLVAMRPQCGKAGGDA